MKFSLELVFSQNNASKTVADISVSGTKLHINYSDGTSKDMDMPPSLGVQFKCYYRHQYTGTVTYDTLNKNSGSAVYFLSGQGPDLSFYNH